MARTPEEVREAERKRVAAARERIRNDPVAYEAYRARVNALQREKMRKRRLEDPAWRERENERLRNYRRDRL